MASFDGSNKSVAGGAQHIAYHEAVTPYVQKLIDDAMANASEEAIRFCNPTGYMGPDIECDAATLTPEQWLARRQYNIGGSDCSAVFGENHFKNNLELYYQKTGQKVLVEDEESSSSVLAKVWGHLLEEYADEWLKERYPYNDVLIDTNIYAMPGRPYITANVDRMMRKPDGSYCLVEIKTTSEFNHEVWDDGNIPIPYLYQVRQYMAILGVWECVVVCVFGRDDVVANTVYRDLDEEMRIIQGVEDFWNNNVLAQIPPEPLGTADSVISTIRKYGGNAQKQIPVMKLDTQTFEDACAEYMALYTERAAAKKVFDDLDAQCKEKSVPFIAALGQATVGSIESGDGKTRWTVKYTPRKGARKVDYKKMEAVYPDVYAACVSQDEEGSRTFKMTVTQM